MKPSNIVGASMTLFRSSESLFIQATQGYGPGVANWSLKWLLRQPYPCFLFPYTQAIRSACQRPCHILLRYCNSCLVGCAHHVNALLGLKPDLYL